MGEFPHLHYLMMLLWEPGARGGGAPAGAMAHGAYHGYERLTWSASVQDPMRELVHFMPEPYGTHYRSGGNTIAEVTKFDVLARVCIILHKPAKSCQAGPS